MRAGLSREWLVLVRALALALFTCASTGARADGVADEAEVNFRLGAQRYQAGDYRGALAHFLLSQRLSPNRNVRFNIVRTFQRLGMHPEAFRWCEAALRDETDPALRAELRELLETIQRDVAVVDVTSEPSGATLYVDRVELGSLAETPARLALPEGEHRLIVAYPGYESAEQTIQLEKRKVVEVHAVLRRIVGSVRVLSEAEAEVRVDTDSGPAACTTPCTLALAPGGHLLHFQRPGYRLSPRAVSVSAGQSVVVRAEGVPLTGSLLITSDVRDVLIEVDGQPRGFAPAVVDRVPVGKRQVRLSLAGYEPITREVEVREGRSTKLADVSLVPSQEVTAASRVDQTVDEAPSSVSVVTGYEIEAFRYPTIAEALRGQRGVALSDDGVYTGLTLRGLGQPGDYGNRVLVLQDGATLNDNILWQSYVGYDGRVDLGGLSRIELVRGPGSVLYGTGAVTGLVNLVSQPIPERSSGEVRVTANDARTARGRAAYGTPLGAHGGLSLSLSGGHSDGRDVLLNTTPLATKVAGVERFNAATAQLRARYRDLWLQGFFTLREQDIPAGAYGAVIGDDRNWLRDTRGLVELRYEPELVADRLRLYTRAFGNLYRFRSEQAFASATPDVELVQERFRGTWWGAEARLVGTLTDRLKLTVGSEVQISTRAALHGTTVDAVTLSTNLPYQIYSGYGVFDVRASERVTISLGARVDAWSTFGATVNPRFNVVMRPHPRHIVKLVAGRAFRAPSVYELRYRDESTQVPSTFNGNKLMPELAWSGEAEYTVRFLPHWALVSAVHAQYAEALIEQVHTVPGDRNSPVFYRNARDEALTLGADLEVRRELYRGALFSAMYGALYPRYIGRAPSASSRLPNAPAHYASARFVLPIWAGTKLAFRSSLEAPRRISSTTQARTRTAVITDVVFSGAVWNARLDFALGVYNLFDFRVGLPTDPTFVTRTMPQAGRTLLLSLGLRLP